MLHVANALRRSARPPHATREPRHSVRSGNTALIASCYDGGALHSVTFVQHGGDLAEMRCN